MDPSSFAPLRRALERHPRVPIISGPTPVRRLSRAFPDAELWLKDDSLTHSVYGGNKPRKLEYLLARVKARDQAVLTFGYESSNHAIASAYHCAQQGVDCHLVLVRGPSGLAEAEARLKQRKLEIVGRLATSIETVETYAQAARAGTKKWAMGLGRLRLIPPGGSNALGTLGYVRAALELGEQVLRGDLPEPRAIFVPLGTGGTAVGLAIGLAALGCRTRVYGVKVVPGQVNELPRLRWLARQVRKLLPEIGQDCFKLSNLFIEGTALGEGYGVPTPESLAAVDRWWREERVRLESTYTGKTAAAVERLINGLNHENLLPALFWLTYNDPGKL